MTTCIIESEKDRERERERERVVWRLWNCQHVAHSIIVEAFQSWFHIFRGSIDHWIYRLLDPSTIGSIDLWIHQLLDPPTPASTKSWINWPLDLSSWHWSKSVKKYESVKLSEKCLMQNFTFITFIISKKIAILMFLLCPDSQTDSWPNTDHYTYQCFHGAKTKKKKHKWAARLVS